MNREEFAARLDRAYPGIPEALRSDLIDFAGEVSRCHINALRTPKATWWEQQVAPAARDFLTNIVRGNGVKRKVIEPSPEVKDCDRCGGGGEIYLEAGTYAGICRECGGKGQVPEPDNTKVHKSSQAEAVVWKLVQGEPEIEPYDAGSLNDFGGGDVGWWHDYIRAELDRAYEFYLIQLAAAPQPTPTTPTGGESDE